MDTEEEEARHFSNVDSSVKLEDAPATIATDSELQNQYTEPRSELESAPSAVSPVAEKEGVVDVEVAVGGEDLIVGEEKDGMLGSGVEMKDSYPVDGNKEGGDGEDSHMEGERAEFVEDETVDDAMDETEDAGNVSDERLTAEGIDVPPARQQVAELAQVEQKVTDDVADVANERRTDEATEKNWSRKKQAWP
ncbi:uncharacterized protein LOC120171507 [Hibiscus syriacus]|uniref:uncharacterized protein LOC120171507 n=1 Tax=Hibiscus syriacus TaxID=106335 RepID=UPI0019231FE1|nr:uncharacterized protein LOC120171507 [Hibiscus syriacus]